MRRKTILLAGASLLAMTAQAQALEALGSLIISALLSVGAGSLLPAASAAAIGLGALTLAATVANVAFSFVGAKAPSVDPQEVKNTTKGSEGPGRYAFGRIEAGGEVAFGNTAGYDIYRLLLHAFGPLSAIEAYFYDGQEMTVESNGDVSSPPWATSTGSRMKIQTKVGDGTETAWPDLITDFPTLWTADHKVQGIAQTLLRATNPGTASTKFQTLFQGGIKPLVLRGRFGEFYDPRNETLARTINGVLHVLHFWRMLPAVTDAVLDLADIGAVATAAEVAVPTLTGTAPRCQLSGGWKGPLTTDIVEDMLESAGLDIRTTADGKYTLEFIEDDPASEITLYDRHILDRDHKTGPDGAKRPNICTLKYFSPERRYEVAEIDLTDAPWAKVQDEIDKYGEQEFPVELIFCCDASQAQRIARRLFHMARAEFGMIKLNWAGMAPWGMRTGTIEIPDVGEGGASTFMKCRFGSVRPNDESGTVEIPYQVIPDILTTPWNPAVDEVAAPPVLEALQYESELDTPAAPSAASIVQYADLSYETRVKFASVTGGTTAEAVFRTYTGVEPNAYQSMTEYDGITTARYGYAVADTVGEKVDFKCRFFNSNDEGSYFSELLTVDPMVVDNTAPAPPTLDVIKSVDGGSGERTYTAEASTTEMHLARLLIQRKIGSGEWTDRVEDEGRPEYRLPDVLEQLHGLTDEWSRLPTETSITIKIRAIAYTSNGTSTMSAEYSDTIPGTGGGA